MDSRATLLTFQSRLEEKKNKKINSKSISYIFLKKKKKILIFQELELSGPKIKTFLYFLKKTFFLYFGKWSFLAPSLKNLLYFLKNFLYFRRELSQFQILKKENKLWTKFSYFFLKNFFLDFSWELSEHEN